jgi:toxin ParE1/3/4
VKHKPLILRAQADRDLQAAAQYYLSEGGERVAMGLIDAVERACQQIRRNPSGGSPRYAHELDLPDLRHWPLRRYPYLIFYVERPENIDIWRILHARRDIPVWMRPEGSD